MWISQFFLKKKTKRFQLWGKKGEELAKQHLQREGYRILGQNYVNKKGYRIGEIDIIAQDKEMLVFVEVKTRRRFKQWDLPPEMFVNREKIRHLERMIYAYLKENRKVGVQYRFDVVGIVYNDEGKIEVKHIKNAFL